MNNICKFLPGTENGTEINILNFVYEKNRQTSDISKCEVSYRVHIVSNGIGKINILGKSYNLNTGDIFFTFPSTPYTLESIEEFEYIYISYMGTRTYRLMDTLNINKKNFIFGNFSDLIPVWKSSILDNNSILTLRCEGILLYTFSAIGEQFLEKEHNDNDILLLIKKYIDENFSKNTISLEKISKEFSYNKKYVSGAFKQKFKIGIAKYINVLRIQKACTLIEQGFTSIKDLSFQCGFSEPFYFSKVFKSQTGLPPREYIKKVNSK